MEDRIDEGLRRDVGGAHDADSAEHRLVTLEAEGQTRAQPPSTAFQVRRVDHPLGVVLSLGGEADLATAPLLQAQRDRATGARRAVVVGCPSPPSIRQTGAELDRALEGAKWS